MRGTLFDDCLVFQADQLDNTKNLVNKYGDIAKVFGSNITMALQQVNSSVVTARRTIAQMQSLADNLLAQNSESFQCCLLLGLPFSDVKCVFPVVCCVLCLI